jgi:hypothetical protein
MAHPPYGWDELPFLQQVLDPEGSRSQVEAARQADPRARQRRPSSLELETKRRYYGTPMSAVLVRHPEVARRRL